jgi:hypothetical protein
MFLARGVSPGVSFVIFPLLPVGTGVVATPGCVLLNVEFTDLTVNNATEYLNVFVNVAGVGTRFAAVRFFYHLQVSPAPAVASFGDVPTTHPFFRFIEALKASGITGGCQASPPLYCPDAPLTRGQMAVFLSTALGLHFAP